MTGPERIIVLIPKLHHVPAEFGKVIVYPVYHPLAFKLGLVLDDPDIAYRLYNTGIDIPESRIAEKVCIVVKESRVSGSPAECDAVPLYLTQCVGADKPHKTVLRFLFLREYRNRNQKKEKKIYEYSSCLHTISGLLATAKLFPGPEFRCPPVPVEHTVLEKRVNHDICCSYLLVDECVNRFDGLLLLYL